MSEMDEVHPPQLDAEAFEHWLFGAEVDRQILHAAQPFRGMAEEARKAYSILLDEGFADPEGLAAGACLQAIAGCRQNRVVG